MRKHFDNRNRLNSTVAVFLHNSEGSAGPRKTLHAMKKQFWNERAAALSAAKRERTGLYSYEDGTPISYRELHRDIARGRALLKDPTRHCVDAVTPDKAAEWVSQTLENFVEIYDDVSEANYLKTQDILGELEEIQYELADTYNSEARWNQHGTSFKERYCMSYELVQLCHDLERGFLTGSILDENGYRAASDLRGRMSIYRSYIYSQMREFEDEIKECQQVEEVTKEVYFEWACAEGRMLAQIERLWNIFRELRGSALLKGIKSGDTSWRSVVHTVKPFMYLPRVHWKTDPFSPFEGDTSGAHYKDAE